MVDKEKEAYWGGYKDQKDCGGQANSNPISEMFSPSYDPPKDHGEAYKAGWNAAKKD